MEPLPAHKISAVQQLNTVHSLGITNTIVKVAVQALIAYQIHVQMVLVQYNLAHPIQVVQQIFVTILNVITVMESVILVIIVKEVIVYSRLVVQTQIVQLQIVVIQVNVIFVWKITNVRQKYVINKMVFAKVVVAMRG